MPVFWTLKLKTYLKISPNIQCASLTCTLKLSRHRTLEHPKTLPKPCKSTDHFCCGCTPSFHLSRCGERDILKKRHVIMYWYATFRIHYADSLVMFFFFSVELSAVRWFMLHTFACSAVFRYHWQHDDVIKWKHFSRYWPLVRRIHRSPVNSPHKDQWRGALMLSLILVWMNGWVNNGEAGDLRRYRAYYDVTVVKPANGLGCGQNKVQ